MAEDDATAAADDALFARVIAQSRRGRLYRAALAMTPGSIVAIVADQVGRDKMTLVGIALALVGWLASTLRVGVLPWRRALFARGRAISAILHTPYQVRVTVDDRGVRLYGELAQSTAFRQAFRRRWPDAPMFVSVLPIAPPPPTLPRARSLPSSRD